MAELFDRRTVRACRLLDPGAGTGSLSSAFLNRRISGGFDFEKVTIDAFEIDYSLHDYLKWALAPYLVREDVSLNLRGEDFIHAVTGQLSVGDSGNAIPKYTHAILNPPYKKIRSDSVHRMLLRQVGIEVTNLYAAFIALSLCMLEERGQLVAIVPRSFCNGRYHRAFRKFILQLAAIKRIHLFGSRSKVFVNASVLQETVIIVLERGAKQNNVVISTSSDGDFHDLNVRKYPFCEVVASEDTESVIRIPNGTDIDPSETELLPQCALDDIGVSVSTGPVVDFRVKQHLCALPEPGAVPLLRPANFTDKGIEWPKIETKKAGAIRCNNATERLLFLNGYYCVVRRCSSKEERRRIVARVINPNAFGSVTLLGFENHLNVFHCNKRGLDRKMAYALADYLNSDSAEWQFRQFSGSTQVNAADLRRIRYPDLRL